MNDGYIKISRKILGWEWYKDINTFRLFMHLLLKAEWKPTTYRGEEIERGACASSLAKLSEETKLTVNEVRTALKHLQSTGEVTCRSRSKYSVYHVNNYDQYQAVAKKIGAEPGQENRMAVSEYQIESKKKPARRFNNFTGRSYDMDKLTRGILQAQETGGRDGRSN